MSQNGGLMVPVDRVLSGLTPEELARREATAKQQEAVSSVQLGWVPRLYYWMKQKYADIGSCNLTEDPIWLLGTCYHLRMQEYIPGAPALAPAKTAAPLARFLRNFASKASGSASEPEPAEDMEEVRGSFTWDKCNDADMVKPGEAGGRAVWERQFTADLSGSDEFGGEAIIWTPYTPDEMLRLEAAAAARQKTVDVGGKWYVDLVHMEQMLIEDPKSGRCQVRRRVVPAGAANDTDGQGLDTGVAALHSDGESMLPGWGNFLEHVVSKIWCTYREGFLPVGPPIYTTDAGWGCMLRTAQMLLAQSLLKIELGADWLLPQSPASLDASASSVDRSARSREEVPATATSHTKQSFDCRSVPC